MGMKTLAVGLIAAGMLASSGGPAGAQMQDVLVSADWLSGHLVDADVVILHAEMQRSRYEAGHLPGARFLDMAKLVWDGDPAWGTEMRAPAEIDDALESAGVRDDHHHVVIYAANPLYASRAFMTLEVMGMKGRVHLLDGGLGGWREDGRAVTTEEPETVRGDVRLQPTDDVLVSADWIHERLTDERIVLVDARPDDEYTGEDGGMGGMTNPGHIPGAEHMYWEELVESRAIPRVLPRADLRELFTSAGVDEGDTVVAYCMVGWRASFTYLAARMLGYETKFYDGSWHDWGTREDLPYVTGTSPR